MIAPVPASKPRTQAYLAVEKTRSASTSQHPSLKHFPEHESCCASSCPCCDDCCCAGFCGPCIQCQILRHESLGRSTYELCSHNGSKVTPPPTAHFNELQRL